MLTYLSGVPVLILDKSRLLLLLFFFFYNSNHSLWTF